MDRVSPQLVAHHNSSLAEMTRLVSVFNPGESRICSSASATQNSAGMERSEPSVILARVIVCLTFAGMVEAGKVCDKVTYDAAVYEYCVEPFSQAMANTDYQHNCPWPSTRRQTTRLYDQATLFEIY
ncbi:receptor activity-modifying 1-like protein [Labeo rohita]|uniref:Receptor activity-modifying 1-like protein n=1 Tax=Labeo rohita TaxID=84645 RepID=A0A498P1R9_LABRO|nr:receptor activity-modifying 1-like protein [Labeo rohita]